MPQPGGRRGQSKALPIIVAGGLAIGVFGGLMLVNGTGSSSAASAGDAGPKDERELGYVGTKAADGGPGGVEEPVVTIDAAPAVVEVDAAPPKPEKITVVMQFDVDPPEATIEVDDAKVDGTRFELELGEKETSRRVKVRASAPGYRSKVLSVKAAEDMEAVEIRLSKRRGGGGNNNGGNNNGGRRGNNELIDL